MMVDPSTSSKVLSEALPGNDLITAGLRDLHEGRETTEALLVAVGAPRLHHLGLELPDKLPDNPEHRLYALLAESDSDSAHSRYNALISRLAKFRTGRSMRQPVDSTRIREFIRALANASRSNGRVYLVGSASAVLLGWRNSTIDVNLKMVPESDEMLRSLPALKERLQINIEIAAPDHFIPELPNWQERSLFIQQEGKLAFFHYDFYAQALAKIERGHEFDLKDVREMARRGLIESTRLIELFGAIEAQIYRYPALDEKSFRQAVERVILEIAERREGELTE